MSLLILRSHLVAALLMLPAIAESQDALHVGVDSDQREYVFREPIRLTITVTNLSPSLVRIPQASRLRMDEMEFIYFEVVTPTVIVGRRKSVRQHAYSIKNYEYMGVPLAPGDSVQFFYYPVLTNVSVDEWGATLGPTSSVRTFPAPGSYRLRAVLHSKGEYKNLFGSGNEHRIWRSNELTILIRSPDKIEKELLDVLWHCDPTGEGGIGLRRVDMERLERTINEYPDQPLTRHLRYARGRLLYAQSISENHQAATIAVSILSDLSTESPGFRNEEVRMFLARSYRNAGQMAAAEETLSGLMDERPVLWTNWPFVVTASTLTPDPSRSLHSWQVREMREGAKPVPREGMSALWSE